ncbi:hypothetical protein IEC338SC_3071 [Acinetobacter pittii]|uniref:Acb2/Tad1 hairpin domain-containing protein n=1 Tax=Acinetobacter pittii TaxID=48296 RepID=A0AB33BDI3_ACIPI|nr:hypothetical protein [Acinetobacter pittii]AMX20186.1 hypothetical protein IEC338SC_3071 [Acinetobacter pittii]
MENQHRKIKGYRELSQEEVDLMNRIKEKGAELLALQAELVEMLDSNANSKLLAARESIKDIYPDEYVGSIMKGTTEQCQEYIRFDQAEPFRWAQIGKTDIQTGIMALVRAVAQPIGC